MKTIFLNSFMQNVSSPTAVQMDSQGPSRMDGSNRLVRLLQSSAGSFNWKHFTGHCGGFVDECSLFHHLDLVNVGHCENSVRSQRLPHLNISISEASRFSPFEIHRMFRRLGSTRLPVRHRNALPQKYDLIAI